jgi:hypothetical protein
MAVRLISMQSKVFDAARNAFRQRPTTQTAWDYLVTAVECGGGAIISDRTFFSAVREIVDYLAEGTKTPRYDDDFKTKQSGEHKRPRVLH